MDLPHYQAETAMVEKVEILEQGVLEERGVLAQQVQGLRDLRAPTAVVVAVVVLIQLFHLLP
jgi:hypothetical protein